MCVHLITGFSDVRDAEEFHGQAALLDWLGAVAGDGFEYEMNVPIQAARTGRPIEETEITTTYLQDNAASHFGSLSDSARVYWPLLRCVTQRRPGGR